MDVKYAFVYMSEQVLLWLTWPKTEKCSFSHTSLTSEVSPMPTNLHPSVSTMLTRDVVTYDANITNHIFAIQHLQIISCQIMCRNFTKTLQFILKTCSSGRNRAVSSSFVDRHAVVVIYLFIWDNAKTHRRYKEPLMFA